MKCVRLPVPVMTVLMSNDCSLAQLCRRGLVLARHPPGGGCRASTGVRQGKTCSAVGDAGHGVAASLPYVRVPVLAVKVLLPLKNWAV